ncbi:MarR family transcriptional regulator [Streptomyces sp. NPDC020403]|uniref:MarR family transcriptional regulator n=1 Tax=unclassified Streptomyces TaxID=2593676 RepID=UPI0033FF067A
MATENLSPALRAPAPSHPYPKSPRGYGKRSAPDQRPARADDFALLPERERHIAGYVDHLPDGAAMDIKTLAKHLPLYGQMAVGSALRALTVAGHLRRAQCRTGEGESRWVTLTYWSRTARDNEWWDAFAAAENTRVVAQEAAELPTGPPPPWAPTGTPAEQEVAGSPAPQLAAPEVTEAPPTQATEAPPATPPGPAPRTAPQPAPQPTPAHAPSVPRQRTTPEPVTGSHLSPAYLALARLGLTDPRLALSATGCAALENLATAWLDRGVSTDYLTHALTTGLPTQVDSPVGFVRRRLRDKLPPHLPATPKPATPDAPARRLLVECTDCGRPGPSETLPDGLCRPCRTPAPESAPADPVGPEDPPAERDIHALVGNLRNLMRTP